MKPRTRLYGDCVENPTKVTKRSEKTAEKPWECGKGDWTRPYNQTEFDKNYEKIFGKKTIKLYDGEEVEV